MSEFIDEFIGTWKKVITTPGDFFKEMPTSGGYEEPLKFAVVNYLISGIGIALITFGSMFVAVIAAPIFGIIMLFIFGLMFHICFKIVGGSGSYEGTVRIMAYASAVEAISWIPIIGWIIGLYAIYLGIVGGTFVHNITTLRSAIAIFIPIVVLTTIAVLLIVVLGAAFLAALGAGRYCGY
ncbi:MAG: YIP1 family protein [Euryarchaeota archaeon]|nr:YIP1 family protein [Euryarchaeota archaeon]